MRDINLFYFLYPVIGIMSIIGIYINQEKLYFKIITIFLTIISMCRFDFGYDYFAYWIVGEKTFIDNPIVNDIYQRFEFGIKRLYDLTRFLGHPQYFFLITGFIISILLYFTFEKESKSPIISLILFLFIPLGFIEFNHFIRQAMAISIVFYFTKFSYNKKYFIFVLSVLLASLFHLSAVLCLIFLFIPKKKIKVELWIFGSIILFFILKYVFPYFILKIYPQYFYLLKIDPKLVLLNSFNLKVLTLLFIILVFLEVLKEKYNIRLFNKGFILKDYEVYQFNLFGIGLIFSLMLAIIYKGDLSKRIGMYFLVYGFLVAGNYINIFNVKFLKWIKIIIIFVVILFKICLTLKSGTFILNKKPFINEQGIYFNRPNSGGLRLFFGKKYEDMSPYLGEIKFEKK